MERHKKRGRKHTHKHTQVDLLAKLSAMPGNGMIVDCRGFDRGIWLV